MPVGTVMFWHADLTGVPALPDGWVLCDGQTLDDPKSPLDGQVIPDINGSNQMIRASDSSGNTGGQSEIELTLTADNIPQHSHSYTSFVSATTTNFQNGVSANFGGVASTAAQSRTTGTYGQSSPTALSFHNEPPHIDLVAIMKVRDR